MTSESEPSSTPPPAAEAACSSRVLHAPPSWFTSIQAAGAALRSGEASPRTLVEFCLERIDRLDGELRAWVRVDRAEALAAADRAGEELLSGFDRGPLHGIPLGVKDVYDVAGLPTLAGSTLLSEEPARRDAAVVARLRGAGAILLGKTVTTEFACLDPSPTFNPWDLACTPGGSSSGSAAGLAAGTCLASLGTQTGGSLTRPASYCGVAAWKPTYGLLPVDGVVPISRTLDHAGVLARSARDLGVFYETLLDRRLPTDPKRPPRIGVLRKWFEERSSPEAWRTFQQTLAWLRLRGAVCLESSLPDGFNEVLDHHLCIMASEAADFHRLRFPAKREAFGPKLAALLDAGRLHSALEYLAALEARELWRSVLEERFLAEGVDVWIAPSAPSTAPRDRSSTGSPVFNAPWSFLGWPTVGAPGGLAADGLPVGLQWIAPPGADGRLIRWAAWSEAEDEEEA